MGNYHFTVDNGGKIEVLGATPLANDDAAIAFGKRVIQDFKRHSEQYPGWVILISEGDRTVAAIPFELDAIRRTSSELTREGYEISR
jgi:hypothetical protein